jgi:hypothetical protein
VTAAADSRLERTWYLVSEAAQRARDLELLDVAMAYHTDLTRQLAWLTTRMQATAPALLASP